MGEGGRYIFDTHLKVASCCTRADNVANLQCNPQKQLTLWQMHCIQQGADKQTGKGTRKWARKRPGRQQLGYVWLPSASA